MSSPVLNNVSVFGTVSYTDNNGSAAVLIGNGFNNRTFINSTTPSLITTNIVVPYTTLPDLNRLIQINIFTLGIATGSARLFVGGNTTQSTALTTLTNTNLWSSVGDITTITGNVSIGKTTNLSTLDVSGRTLLSGNVSIGKTTNLSTLDVNGNTLISGNVSIGKTTNDFSLDLSGTLFVSSFSLLNNISEKVFVNTSSTSPITLDYNQGSIQYLPNILSIASNFTCNIINLPNPADTTRTYTLSILFPTTNRVWCGTVQVNGVVQTLYYNSGNSIISAAVASALVISQSFLYYNGTVLSSVSNYSL
jgi:hypothetical protein